MTAISLLCEILAQGAKASAETYRPKPGYQALLSSGLVQETGLVQSTHCVDCDHAHDAEVVFEGGQYGYFCPQIGFVPVDRSKLIAVRPEPKNIVQGLADAFGCRRRKTTPIHGQTWRVGAVETPGGDATIYLHPRLRSSEDLQDLETALRREVRSPFRLILTAEGALMVLETKTVRLDGVVELDPLLNTMVPIADVLAIVDAPIKSSGGRPNQYGGKLDRIILARSQYRQALSGHNEEAKAIRDVFREQYPNEKPPSLPTIKRYLTKAQGGS